MLLRGGLTEKWIKLGLLTEYISNLRACNCGLQHLQGLGLLLRLWIHHTLPAHLLLLLFWCGGKEKRKELLITCFVWSESPCKYMNSKFRKSNLVAHWYILLFAYLPAPVVTFNISGHGISNTQPCAYSSLLCPAFPSFSILLFFVCFSILSTPPQPHLSHPFPSVSLRHQGVFPPRQDAWQGSRWNGEQMTNLSLQAVSLFPSPPLSCQRPTSALLPPSFQHVLVVSDHIDIQTFPGWISPSLSRKVSPNHEGRTKVVVPNSIPYLRLDKYNNGAVGGALQNLGNSLW